MKLKVLFLVFRPEYLIVTCSKMCRLTEKSGENLIMRRME